MNFDLMLRSGMNVKTLLFPSCFILLLLFSSTYAQLNSVSRCGGFIQTASEILDTVAPDYSPITIKVVTLDGIEKERTDCAPNGYYFLPVYEDGIYRLIVDAPSGWNIVPQSQQVNVENGICNENEQINFLITGFAISGTIQSESCPDLEINSSISVKLSQKGKIVQEVNSSRNSFQFTNVLPGLYEITVSHPSWTFSESTASATVSWGSSIISNDMIISGYALSGQVLSSEGEAMKDVKISLYEAGNHGLFPSITPKYDTYHRNAIEVEALKWEGSDEKGNWKLSNVPCGSFTIIPTYQGEHTSFDLDPKESAVSVVGESVKLENAFRVVGFSVLGSLLDTKGRGIENVEILLDGEVKSVSNAEGTFRLDKLSSNFFDLSFHKPFLYFETLSHIHITPNLGQLPSVELVGVSVCGSFSFETNFRPHLTTARAIHLETTYGVLSTTSNNAGEYCFEKVAAGSGEAFLRPTLLPGEPSLLFEPSQRSITILDEEIMEQNFTQAKFSVFGSVSCLSDPCPSLHLLLVSTEYPELQYDVVMNGNEFEVAQVYPGNYLLSLADKACCWAEQHHSLHVVDKDISGIQFEQTGYVAKIQASHKTNVSFGLSTSAPSSFDSLSLTKGETKLCLPEDGEYKFVVAGSCFKFDKEEFYVQSSHAPTLLFNLAAYPIIGTIEVEEDQEGLEAHQLTVHVVSSNGKEFLLPVKPKATPDTGNPTFTFQYMGQVGESIEVSVTSSSERGFLFYPQMRTATVYHADDCPPQLEVFKTRPGLYISGKISPIGVEGVHISVFSKSANNPSSLPLLSVTTDQQGEYTAGPLYDHLQYSVTAEKEGYSFSRVENGFKVVELTQITVLITDQFGEIIPGVLLALTGEKAFFQDAESSLEGKGSFPDLFPGTYYLRPQLKEYQFVPSTIPMEVMEGSKLEVEVKGKRVAYSAFGHVASLAGDHEKNVYVYAKGEGGEYEETQTDSQGKFRIRGLQPATHYTIGIKPSVKFERASPQEIVVEVREKEDVRDLEFISFRAPSRIHLSGVVHTADEFLDSITVELYVLNKKANVQEFVRSSKLSLFHSFDFPDLPKEDYTLKLTSSLNSVQYDYDLPVEFVDTTGMEGGTSQQHSFFVSFRFNASLHLVPNEIANVSFYPLIFITIAFFGYWYKEQLQHHYHNRSASPASLSSSSEHSEWIPHAVRGQKGISNKKAKALAKASNKKK